MMYLTEETDASATILAIDGRVDGVTAPDLQDRISQIVERGDSDLLLDCEKMEYISSAGLRAVLLGARNCEQSGGKLTICALQPDCKTVLEISGFHTIIDCHETRAAALQAAAGRSASC